MLVKLTPNFKEIERRKKIAESNNFDYTPQYDEIYTIFGDGIYICNTPFNFSYKEFLEFEDGFPGFEQQFEIFKPDDRKSCYGLADNIEQIKCYYKEEIDNPDRKFIIHLTAVFQDKSNKGKGGGWRWGKWGPYIGSLRPEFEYLDDEDFGEDFEYVIVFGLIEVK